TRAPFEEASRAADDPAGPAPITSMSQVMACTALIRMNVKDGAKQVQIYVRPAREITSKGRFRLIQFVAGSVVDIQEDSRHAGPLEIVRMLYKKRPAATP